MRMWLINPTLMCNKHLLGEHGELHKFLPTFRKGYKVDGRFHPVVQLQFQGYKERHDKLAEEMLRRGMNHKSPLVDIPDFAKIYPEYYYFKVNVGISVNDLMSRCDEFKKIIHHHLLQFRPL